MTAARIYLLALIVCATGWPAPAGDGVDATPWRAEFVRRLVGDVPPVWDAGLPGFHLHGDIATVQLAPTRAALADADHAALVIAIHTPGEPHLEGLRLRIGEQTIDVSLRPDGESRLIAADGTSLRVPAGTYAVVARADDHMRVSLTPAFLALAADGFEIHWVNYYR